MTVNYNFAYRARTWDSADVEMHNISKKLGITDYEKLDDRAGPNGFPYKIRGQFAKVIIKTPHRTGWHVEMNIKRLKNLIDNHKNGKDFFCLPEKIVESEYAYIFLFPLLDMDLVDWLKNHFWSPVHRDNIFMKICAAVDFLHSNGFVHRDIKLENICMRNNEPYLVDLDNCSLAVHNSVKGTRDYMMPKDALRHLLTKRDDVIMANKSKLIDCYALAKTFTLILCIENERKEESNNKIIRKIWYSWCKSTQSSLRAIPNYSETLETMTKWWVLIYNLAYYNEEAIFDSSLDFKDIKIYKNINFD